MNALVLSLMLAASPTPVEQAKSAVHPFKRALKETLLKALETSPEAAIDVCSKRAPELAKAAKVSLDARGIETNSDVREWSFAWRSALFARLRDGESAHNMLQQLFSDRNTCPNLFGLHPPMQIDSPI